MNNVSEVFKYVSDLEKRYPVAEWRIDNIAIWPLVRIVLFRDILSKVNSMENLSSANVKRSFLIRLKQSLRSLYKLPLAYLKDPKSNKDVNRNTQVLLVSNGASFNMLRGKWFEKFCDPISDALKQQNINSLRFDLTTTYLTPRYNSSKFLQFYIDIAIFKSLLFAKAADKFTVNLDQYEDFLEEIKDLKYELLIPTIPYLKKRILKLRSIQKYYEKKISQGNIKVGAKVCYYSDDGMAFNLACNKHKIPSIDIQHGVQGDFHIAYGNWQNIPENGYELLPSHFWCWTQTDVQQINSWANRTNGAHQSFVGGHPFLSIWTKSHPLFKHFSEHLLAKTVRNKPFILISLSPSVSTEKHIGTLLSVVKKTQLDYNWLIRLHPFMSENESSAITSLLKSKKIMHFNIEEATESPLPVVLMHTDVHITYCSSVTLEAAINGIPTIITDNYGSTVFRGQIDEKLMIEAFSEESILNSIPNLLRTKTNDHMNRNLMNFNNGIEYITKLVSN